MKHSKFRIIVFLFEAFGDGIDEMSHQEVLVLFQDLLYFQMQALNHQHIHISQQYDHHDTQQNAPHDMSCNS